MLQQPTSGPHWSVPKLWILRKTYAKTQKNDKTHATRIQIFTHCENLENEVPSGLSDVISIWCQIQQLDILQKRGAIQPHSVSGHQLINTTGWAAINIGIGLQSQKVLKSFPGLAHHRRRKNNISTWHSGVWITSCFEEINLIWVSAWSYPNRTPYITNLRATIHEANCSQPPESN